MKSGEELDEREQSLLNLEQIFSHKPSISYVIPRFDIAPHLLPIKNMAKSLEIGRRTGQERDEREQSVNKSRIDLKDLEDRGQFLNMFKNYPRSSRSCEKRIQSGTRARLELGERKQQYRSSHSFHNLPKTYLCSIHDLFVI